MDPTIFFDGWKGPIRILLIAPVAYCALVVFLRISGKRTLTKLNAFDLVVTDIIMPGLDGIELTRQIREHSTDVPVIVVTSAADPRYVTSARDAGATDYLVKPLNQKHLREKVQQIVEPIAN